MFTLQILRGLCADLSALRTPAATPADIPGLGLELGRIRIRTESFNVLSLVQIKKQAMVFGSSLVSQAKQLICSFTALCKFLDGFN